MPVKLRKHHDADDKNLVFATPPTIALAALGILFEISCFTVGTLVGPKPTPGAFLNFLLGCLMIGPVMFGLMALFLNERMTSRNILDKSFKLGIVSLILGYGFNFLAR